MDDVDVIIVGAGIAGGSLAAVMAREGANVLVLERQTRFRDHVRGELLWPWGVKVAQELGLESVFLDQGGRTVRWMVAHDEGSDRPERDDAGAVFPGVDGSINLAHPMACRALVSAATSAGAVVRMGVRDVRLTVAAEPVVRWVDGRKERAATAPLVVGADGRHSSIRSQARIPFEIDEPSHLIAGLLVDGIEGEVNLAARELDLLFLAFPQNARRARLYFCFPTDQRGRFAGKDAASRFLSAARLSCLNGAGGWHEASPAGPCGTFPGADSRAPFPLADGVVLVGDAAGYENPLRGQGLSMALRDVQDVFGAIVHGSPTVAVLAEYADARDARQRLANLATAVTVWANDGFHIQDPAQRASRYEQIRGDEMLAALSRSFWEGFEAIAGNPTARDITERLEAYS